MTKSNNFPEEYVMVFPTALLKELGYFHGISFEADRYLDVILDKDNHEFMNRKAAETNPDFKQLIPYVIFRHGGSVFSYRRGKLMSEKRLLGNYSVGIGGHISVDDPGLFGTSYDEGLKREVNEEVKINSPFTEKRIALINDDSNDVGSVHFGVVHLFTLEKPLVEAREKSINESRFITIENITPKIENYETWSQHCINALERIFSQE